MTNAAEVYFNLRGNFTPSDVTDAIGFNPTRTMLAGERGAFPKCSHWKFSSGKKEADYINVYDLSRQVVSALCPYADQIAAAIQKWKLNATLRVVLWITMDESVSTPAIGFDADVIRFLDRVGASIDVDSDRVTPEVRKKSLHGTAAPAMSARTIKPIKPASKKRIKPGTDFSR
jgi:hypothetical protein